MSEIFFKREKDRLGREITELKQRIVELEAPKAEQPHPMSPSSGRATTRSGGVKKPFDPWAPTGDAVFDALRSRAGQPKRRSWLE